MALTARDYMLRAWGQELLQLAMRHIEDVEAQAKLRELATDLVVGECGAVEAVDDFLRRWDQCVREALIHHGQFVRRDGGDDV